MGLFVILCISGFLALVGGPTEDDPDIPEPTMYQRKITFVKVFMFLLPAIITGIFQAFAADKRLTPEQREKQNAEHVRIALKADHE